MIARTQPESVAVNRRRIWLVAILALVAVVVALVGIKGGQIATMIKAGKSFTIPPESVTSAKVQAEEWQASRAAVGTLVAVRGVTLGSEVPGMVREIDLSTSMAGKRPRSAMLRLMTM